MLEVKNLVKKYGSQPVLKDLNFSIGKGEVVGFLGANGAGKSTTMNIITGYLSASAGSVHVAGIDIMEEAQVAKKKIGYLPEQPPLYNDMTTDEYLSFAAELKAIPRADRKSAIEEVRELTGLNDMRKRLLRNLSKGFRQRVGLAQALLGHPELLILDEPTVGLDPKQITDIRSLIKKIGEQKTIILSSHILPEVSAICSRILIIDGGKIVADRKTSELLGDQHASKISVKVKGSVSALEAALKAPELASLALNFEISATGDSNFASATLHNLSKDEQRGDIRDALSLVLAKNNLPIYALQSADRSLEEIFLRLTTQEQHGGL